MTENVVWKSVVVLNGVVALEGELHRRKAWK